MSHVKYAPSALLKLEKRWDRQTDGRQTDALRLRLDAASVMFLKEETMLPCSLNTPVFKDRTKIMARDELPCRRKTVSTRLRQEW